MIVSALQVLRREDPGRKIAIAGLAGDDGQATDARLNIPVRCGPDGSDNVFIADQSNHRIP